jgi:hypothetical protein
MENAEVELGTPCEGGGRRSCKGSFDCGFALLSQSKFLAQDDNYK